MQLSVTFSDGRVEQVAPAPVDLVKFERKYEMAASAIEADPRVEYMMFLAWAGLTRTGKEARKFDDFLEDLAEIGEATDPPLPPPA